MAFYRESEKDPKIYIEPHKKAQIAKPIINKTKILEELHFQISRHIKKMYIHQNSLILYKIKHIDKWN